MGLGLGLGLELGLGLGLGLGLVRARSPLPTGQDRSSLSSDALASPEPVERMVERGARHAARHRCGCSVRGDV